VDKSAITFSAVNTSHKFAKNAVLNIIGFGITLPITILLTPYVLRILGKEKYGVWALAAVVTSYAQLSDIGMTTAIVKFIAEYCAKEEVDQISTVVSTTFFAFAIIGGLVTGSLLFLRQFIVVDILRVPLELQSDAIFVISGMVIIFYFNLLFSIFDSVLQGVQRMDITNGILVISRILRAIGMYLVLAAGMGLKGLILNSALMSGINIGMNVIAVRLLIHGFVLHIRSCSLQTFKRIVAYAVNILMARLIGLGEEPINKIILSRWGSLSYVAFYDIGYRIADIGRGFISKGLLPLLPASAELHGKGDYHQLKSLLFSLLKLIITFGVPYVFLIVSIAQPLIQAWLGNGYILSARALQVIMVVLLFQILVTPHYIILQGIGKPQVNTVNHLISAIVNIAGAIILIRYLRFYGVLASMIISTLIAVVHLDVMLRQVLRIQMREYLSIIPWKWLVGMFLWSLALWYSGREMINMSLTFLSFAGISSLLYCLFLFPRTNSRSDREFLLKVVQVVVESVTNARFAKKVTNRVRRVLVR